LIEHLREKDHSLAQAQTRNEELGLEITELVTRLACSETKARAHAEELQDVLERSDAVRDLDLKEKLVDLEAERDLLKDMIDSVVDRNRTLEDLLNENEIKVFN